MQEVLDFLKECGVFYLATVEGDQPRVRPFGALAVFEDKLYTQTGKVKNVSKQLAANPKAEICAFKGGKWIRIETTLVDDPRLEAQEAMLAQNPGLARMYKAGDGNTTVLALTEAKAVIASFTAPPEVIEF